jgi:outer membrane protein assembly factor BamA
MRMRHALVLVAMVAAMRSARGAPEPTPDTPPTGDTPPPETEPPPDQTPPPPPDDDAGPLILVERIDIFGNTATSDEIIRRALPITPGDVLHSDDQRLTELKFKVLALGYFRSVSVAMKKGTERGQIVIRIDVAERGTIALNRLWFGTNDMSPWWVGADVTERNLLGLGIAVGGGLIYAAHGDIIGSRDQWAGEIRAADGALLGSPLGINGSITLVHGSEPYRISGADDDKNPISQRAFSYRRFGARLGATYDVTPLSRISASLRAEDIHADLPVAPTQLLPDGRTTAIDLHLAGNDTKVTTIELGFDRDTRPDPVIPHAGGRITLSGELGSGLFGSSYDFAAAFARYEHWWPVRNENHAIGLRVAGGIVIGNAPRFDRIHISDVDRLLTPRALGLVLSTAGPLDLLGTRSDKPTYGDLGASTAIEYTHKLFRGTDNNRVYGGDFFVGAGLWGLAETDNLRVRDASLWQSLPVDIFWDAGVRLDTDVGVFELTIANALGRLR